MATFTGPRSAVAGDYDFFNPQDPAFDQASEDYDFEKALETRDYDKYLPRKNGVTPWRFVMRRLNSRERRYLRDVGARHGSNTMAWWSIALALRKVISPNGEEDNVERVEQTSYVRVCDEWMDAIEDDTDLFLTMGAAVIRKELSDSPRD